MKYSCFFLCVLMVSVTQLHTQNADVNIDVITLDSGINGYDISRQLVEGDLAMRATRWEEAVSAYDNVILQWPYWAPVYVKRAMVKFRMGRTTEAQQDLAFAQQLSLNSYRLFSEHNHGERLNILLDGYLGFASTADSLLVEFHELKRQGQFGEAIVELEFLWSSGHMNDGEFAFFSGNLAILQNDYSSAIKYYDRALVKSQNMAIYHNRGLAQILRYNFSEGCENLLTAAQDGHTSALDQWSDLCTF